MICCVCSNLLPLWRSLRHDLTVKLICGILIRFKHDTWIHADCQLLRRHLNQTWIDNYWSTLIDFFWINVTILCNKSAVVCIIGIIIIHHQAVKCHFNLLITVKVTERLIKIASSIVCYQVLVLQLCEMGSLVIYDLLWLN